MRLARLMPFDHVLVDRLLVPRLSLRSHQPHLGGVVFQLVNDRPPPAQVTNILVCGRPIDQLQHRPRPAIEDGKEQTEAERIGVLPDRPAKIPGHAFPDLPQ